MQKIKFILLGAVTLLLGVVSPALAIAPQVSIQGLPEYVSTNNFKLSCSALGASSAQFSFKKEGGSFANFGPVINLNTNPCQVQVSSSEVSEQTKYYFMVTVDGSVSDSTSTFYDISGPSPVSGYYKEKMGDAFFKLHWKNPGDTDFSKVVIYRGETPDFPADSSHEIARVSGGINSDMTYDEHQPDGTKTYYYSIRALDKANNSSSLVGDGSSSTSSSSSTSTGSILGTSTGTGGAVSLLPIEKGSVKGSDATSSGTPSATATPSDEASGSVGGLLNWIKTHKKISLVVAALLGLATYGFYFSQKRK